MSLLDADSLKEWFRRKGRALPWRGDPSPYEVWISEVMLQQTQVAVVKKYFERWMRHFPTLASLALAPQEEVMKLWEGLGYYSRARHLHEGAQYLLENHKGELPQSKEELKKIKGVGSYTIGAILSFAFHQKAAAVDGNVLRVFCRYFLIEEDSRKSAVRKRIEELVEEALPEKEPWVAMEALIELGAQICAKLPKCQECPLQKGCGGYRTGQAISLPFKSRKTEYSQLFRHVVIMRNKSGFLVRQEKKGKVMEGLYEFPYFELGKKKKPLSFLRSYLKNTFGFELEFYRSLPLVKHAFTRFRATLFSTVWSVEQEEATAGYHWVSLEEARTLPFSSGHRRILRMLEEGV